MFTVTLLVFISVTALAVFMSLAVRSQEVSSRKDIQDRLRYMGQTPPQREKEKDVITRAVLSYQQMVKEYLPENYSQKIEVLLDRADLSMSVTEMVALHFLGYLVTSTIFFILTRSVFLALFLGMAGLTFPVLYIKAKIRKRIRQFNDLLVDATTLLANILKSGFALRQAIQVLAEEMPPPVCDEFSKALQEVSYGLSLEEALKNLNSRIDSSDLDLLITAILIQLDIGGNLSEILEKIAETIRDRIRIKGEVKALTAQGKMSGIMVAALPWLNGILVFMFNPKYIMLLFTTVPGMIILGLALVLMGLGGVLIAATVRIDF